VTSELRIVPVRPISGVEERKGRNGEQKKGLK